MAKASNGAQSTTRISDTRRSTAQEYSSVDNADDDIEGDAIFRMDDEHVGIVGEDVPRRRPVVASHYLSRFCLGGVIMVMVSIAFVVLMLHRNKELERKIDSLSNRFEALVGSSHTTNDDDYDERSNDDEPYSSRTIHYDSSKVASVPWNPYDLRLDESTMLVVQSFPDFGNNIDDTNDLGSEINGYGYVKYPNIVNGNIVFASEGDLYYTRIVEEVVKNSSMPAMKLATTVGNILYPKINPVYPYLIAFRATYDGRSDVYLIDLRTNTKKRKQKYVQRLTYAETNVMHIVGWKPDGKSLLFGAGSMEVSLPDERVYEIALTDQLIDGNGIGLHGLEIRPVPLSQAFDGVYYNHVTTATSDTTTATTNNVDTVDECFYFVRFRQSSSTIRYVGGTAESIWAYCTGEDVAVHVTHDYNGTSKHPGIVSFKQSSFLVFMSDRSLSSNAWLPSTMNVWSIPLPNRTQLYGGTTTANTNATKSLLYSLNPSVYVQLTFVSCQFNGKGLQEYSIDPVSGQMVLRVGADLYHMPATDVQTVLLSGSSIKKRPVRLPIHVISDFREEQERMIKIDTNKHLTGGDLFETSFGSLAMLLTLRGQVWVAPVIADYTNYETNKYDGAGINMPERLYRVVPGALTGGAIRVLKALHVPLLTSSQKDDDELFHFEMGRNQSSATTSTRNSTNATSATPKDDGRRLSLVLATDPDSPTAEHAFYLIEVQADSINMFMNLDRLPKPFIGGSISGGPTVSGGLGTVLSDSLTVSPCGRRFAWADTDNRICIMTMPIYLDESFMNKTSSSDDDTYLNSSTTAENDTKFEYHCLPETNERNEPIAGTMATMVWSPGGRYLAIEHSAKNQFAIISIVDCGKPDPGVDDTPGKVVDIRVGRAVQVTPSRFNCYGMYWGISSFDLFLQGTLAMHEISSSTLYFLSDRDIISDVMSPWGSRQPSPHFSRLSSHVYALPFSPQRPEPVEGATREVDVDALLGRFAGGGAMEVFADELLKYKKNLMAAADTWGYEIRRRQLEKISSTMTNNKNKKRLSPAQTNLLIRYLAVSSESENDAASPFPKDLDIDFGKNGDLRPTGMAYRLSHIAKAKYLAILSQSSYTGGLVLITLQNDGSEKKDVIYYDLEPFPSDGTNAQIVDTIMHYGLSTDRRYFYLTSELGKIRVASNTASGIFNLLGDEDWTRYRADVEDIILSIWPSLEYQQMYSDAWRLLRDYFYDENMHGVNWTEIYSRYKALVPRCAKREELDDVLSQMISELSALHAFVYGGEYRAPQSPVANAASLGVNLKRVPEWKGYMITEMPEPDPDFNLVDGEAIYSPLSDQSLRLSGQRGLQVGDVIVGINGESVLQGTDINMHLRGVAGRSVRLEVLRLKSRKLGENLSLSESIPEPLIVVPMNVDSLHSLRYNAWEWKTRQNAKELAAEAGFTVAYMHLRAMDREGEDAFARGFFPDYDKDALILDVRHNNGGNIDSWIENYLQRQVWSVWSGRGVDHRNGDIDWDQQFAFRGKVVVLIDEFTASNGEGVARGISELGLGKLIGQRTWGGGIWGSSANLLVDGGIAAAPQWGVYSEKLGWGAGVEMTGVSPDVVIDNDPHASYFGKDMQLERAISELKAMITADPTPEFSVLHSRPDMSLQVEDCPV